MKARIGTYIRGNYACGIGIKLVELGHSEKTIRTIWGMSAALNVPTEYIRGFVVGFDGLELNKPTNLEKEGWEDAIKAREEITLANLW